MLAVHHAGYEGFRRAERPWRALAATRGTPRFFQTYDWYAAYFAHLRPADVPMGVIELQRDGHCVGIFPYLLTPVRKFGLTLRVLALPDSPHLILADVLLAADLEPRSSLRAIHACLAQAGISWHALHLARVPEHAHARLLAAGLPGALVRPGGGSRYFDAREPYAELSARFAGRLRKTLKKGHKRLGESGALEWLCISCGDARMPWAFERFLALEASGWKGEHGTGSAIALSADVMNFYRQLTAVQSPELRVEIHLLCVAGQPVAGQLASVCGTQRSIHKIAYDESWQHASPGSVLMANTLERSCQQRPIERLSLVTDMPWMQDWNAARETVYDIWIPRHALYSRLARAALRAKALLGAREPAQSAQASGSRDSPTATRPAEDAVTPAAT